LTQSEPSSVFCHSHGGERFFYAKLAFTSSLAAAFFSSFFSSFASFASLSFFASVFFSSAFFSSPVFSTTFSSVAGSLEVPLGAFPVLSEGLPLGAHLDKIGAG